MMKDSWKAGRQGQRKLQDLEIRVTTLPGRFVPSLCYLSVTLALLPTTTTTKKKYCKAEVCVFTMHYCIRAVHNLTETINTKI